MSTHENEIASVWRELRDTHLAKTKSVNNTNLHEFSSCINRLTPQIPGNMDVWNFVRKMYLRNSDAFLEYTRHPELEHYILMTGGKQVVERLGLTDQINIELSGDKTRFKVTRCDTKEISNAPGGSEQNGPRRRGRHRGGRRRHKHSASAQQIPPLSMAQYSSILLRQTCAPAGEVAYDSDNGGSYTPRQSEGTQTPQINRSPPVSRQPVDEIETPISWADE